MRALVQGLGISLRADRRRTVAVIALSLVTGVLAVVSAWWLKVIVDAATRHDLSGATAGAVALAVTVGIGMVASASVTRMMFVLKEHTGLLLDQRLIGLSGGTATIDHLERPAYVAQLDVLRREGHVLASVGFNVADAVEVVVEAVATAVLLAAVDPVLLAIPLFALPSLWAGGRAERLRQRTLDDTAGDVARARRLFELATSVGPAKELRIYGLGDEFLARHGAAGRNADRALDRAAGRGLAWIACGWLAFTVGYAAAVVLVVRSALAGTATVGEVVFALTIIARVNAQVGGAVGTFSVLARTTRVAGRYRWLEEYAASRRQPTEEDERSPVPSRLVHGIELRAVTFRYPDAEAETLDSVDLFLPAGSTVALVGDNGAGKSTLVKLLCGLYRPTSGAIAVDGVDLGRFDIEEWRSRISAGFQDFVRFELLAGETVGVGHVPSIDNARAVAWAVDRAQAGDVAAALPAGLATPLGASFEGGSELSGGQWQKLALARTMMRPQPLLLVLDEPTASLDAEAEHALFSRFAAEGRTRLAGRGAIVVLVSHRFSTVYMADIVVVVDRGRVVEVGSHDDLIARRGLYAELYELQARSYR